MPNELNNLNRATAEGMLTGYLTVLATNLPTNGTTEFEDEVRAHLSEHAAAYEELGCNPAEAMRLAIERFGVPKRLANAMAEPPAPVGIVIPVSIPVLALGSAVGGTLVLSSLGVMYWWGLTSFAPPVYSASLGLFPGLVSVIVAMKSRLTPYPAALLAGFLCGPGFLLLGCVIGRAAPFDHPEAVVLATFMFAVGALTQPAVAWFLKSCPWGRGLRLSLPTFAE